MDRMPLSDIIVGPRHRKDLGDIESLAASIGELGLLQPVVVTEDRRLVAGYRRLKALEQLGCKKVPIIVAPNLDDAAKLLKAERDENTCRKDFTLSEAHEVGLAVAAAYKPVAQEAQKQSPGRPKKGRQTFPTLKQQNESKRTTSQAAAAVNMSRPTFEKIGAVKASGDKSLIAEMNRTGKVNGAYKKLKRAEAAEQIAAEPPPLPAGPFRVIVADPPWQYDARGDDASHRTANPYPAMTVDEIATLPVEALAHDDAVLWLWTTNAFMVQAHEIAVAWGFTVKTILTWVKDRMGTGDWLRGQTEHCLFCVRWSACCDRRWKRRRRKDTRGEGRRLEREGPRIARCKVCTMLMIQWPARLLFSRPPVDSRRPMPHNKRSQKAVPGRLASHHTNLSERFTWLHAILTGNRRGPQRTCE